MLLNERTVVGPGALKVLGVARIVMGGCFIYFGISKLWAINGIIAFIGSKLPMPTLVFWLAERARDRSRAHACPGLQGTMAGGVSCLLLRLHRIGFPHQLRLDADQGSFLRQSGHGRGILIPGRDRAGRLGVGHGSIGVVT